MRHLTRFISTSFLFVAFAPAWAQESSDVELNIAEQPLSTSLREVADSFDLTIAFYSESTDGLEAPALDGDFTSEAALGTLLADTNLEYTFINDSSVAVRPVATEERGASDSKNLTPAPVLMAQNQTSQAQTTSNNRSSEGGTSIVTGKVTDARTGANLKGAKVTIEETGQWASTNDLGRFRFASVPQGRYTLSVSFLGYAQQSSIVSVSADSVSHSFALRGGNEIEEIVVFGQRSARALALNQERVAENSRTVISSDFIGDLAGTTISEALRRAPGVAFEQDFETGDGTNIIVRGLAPDLNTVTFNGIELPEGSGEGRSASLNTILAESIDSVTISKTLLPNQDSAGIGGLVEIETKSPLDRAARFAQFSIDGRQRDEDFLEDVVVSGIVSGRFGADDNVGLGASIQHRKREIRSVTGGTTSLQFGEYLPRDSEGGFAIRRSGSVAPGTLWPFFDTPGADAVYPGGLTSNDARTETETVSIGVNGAWDIADHTSVRLDYQYLEEKRSSVRADYQLGASAGYQVRPVLKRDGEELRALTSTTFRPHPTYSANVSNEQLTKTDIFSLRGETVVDKLQFNYSVGYTSGSTRAPRDFNLLVPGFTDAWDPDLFLDQSFVDPVEGIILSLFQPLQPEDESIPVPGFTQAGFDAINDVNNTRFISGSIIDRSGENSRFSADFSTRYSFGSVLDYVEAGFDFEDSEFQSISKRQSIQTVPPFFGTLAPFGVQFDAPILAGLVEDTGLRTWSPAEVEKLFNNLDSLAQDGVISISDIIEGPQNTRVFANEREIAPYLQARVNIGDFELIGGFRYSIYEIEGNDLDTPVFVGPNGETDPEWEAANTIVRTESATQEEFIPRVLLNYRPTEDWVFRAGYFKSIARPQLQLISNRRGFRLDLRPFSGPGRDQPALIVDEGNEDLRPAKTDNFDVSVEYYGERIGNFGVSAFLKRIENLTESNVTIGGEDLDGVNLPDFPTDFDIEAAIANGELFVSRRQPVNNPDIAEIWGLEFKYEKQFTELPGWLSGFGTFGNYTYTQSSKNQPIDYSNPATREVEEFVIEDVRFDGQPEHSGTVALTYTGSGIDAALLYSAQSRRQTTFRANGLSSYSEAYESLDFRIAYNFDLGGNTTQIGFEAVDLLRDFDDPTLLQGQGDRDIYYTNRSYLGGREFRLGLTTTF